MIGRYCAMDRDRRWDRVAARLRPAGPRPQAEHHADSGEQAVRDAYERGETDEFIEPTLVGEEAHDPAGRQRDLLQLPPRPDARDHAGAGRAGLRRGLEGCRWRREAGEPVERYATLTEYEEGWPYPVAFPPERPATTLAEVIAAAGDRQLHVAETEKYPHVTYFFNGGEEAPLRGRGRELVPSPRDVPTYDHKPQMSAPEAAEAFVGASGEDDGLRFGIINFANADMVGHTGVIPAAVRRSRPSTRCLGRGRDGGARSAAASASSPPTTATPTTCSSPTAAPTPPTR